MTGEQFHQLNLVVRNKRDFKMRLLRYDGGSQFFWPCYNGGMGLLKPGTLIIGFWYGQLIVATVIEMLDKNKTIGVQTIPGGKSQARPLKIVMKIRDIAAVLMPE